MKVSEAKLFESLANDSTRFLPTSTRHIVELSEQLIQEAAAFGDHQPVEDL